MNWKSFFSLSIRRYFRWNLLIVIIFFLLACVACLCLHTAWPREEESRFNVSFNVTLDANNDLSACRLVLLSYTLPRCLIKFDYSCACKLAQVKAGARESRSDFRTAVSSRVFFYVDLRLWFISRKINWDRVLKTPFEVTVTVETVSKRPQEPPPPPSVNIYRRCHVSWKSKRLFHESITLPYNRNDSDGKASQKRQRTPQTTMDKQRASKFYYPYM